MPWLNEVGSSSAMVGSLEQRVLRALHAFAPPIRATGSSEGLFYLRSARGEIRTGVRPESANHGNGSGRIGTVVR
jgi:hypothetical protein